MQTLSSVEQRYHRYALYEKGHKLKTIQQTLTILKKMCRFVREERIDLILTCHVREFLHFQREERGWTAKTFRLYRQYMKTFFAWCIQEDLIQSNPVTPISQPPLPQRLPRCLNLDQALKIMAHVHWYPWRYQLEKSRNEAIIATFLYTGIRLSELRNLKVHDVRSSAKEILIHEGKNDKSRVVPIHPKLLSILSHYIRERKRLGVPSLWFFPSVKSEKRLTDKNIHAIFRKISKSTQTKVTPHMLRHTFGRLSVESKINLRVTQQIMGHSDIRTTQIYTYVSIDSMKESIGQMQIL